MRPWIKGAIIGGIFGCILLILMLLTTQGNLWHTIIHKLYSLNGIAFSLGYPLFSSLGFAIGGFITFYIIPIICWIIIGALIGLIIQKINKLIK